MTESEVYDRLCVGCWREKLCHEDMEFCDEYLAETENCTDGPKLYVKYKGGIPVAYAYGEEWAAMALYMDDVGYPTPEEAKRAWEEEENECTC